MRGPVAVNAFCGRARLALKACRAERAVPLWLGST